MPLVFAENEETESGITYEDRTGISYQYPKMYTRMIRPGERFVYYRGRKRRGGGRALQVYFGAGVVGKVQPDPNHEDRLVCDVLDYWTFPTPVPFKDKDGVYFESGAERRGYFQRGVRVVSETDFGRVLEAAQTLGAGGVDLDEADVNRQQPRGPAYASPKVIREVESFATKVAVAELRRLHPRASVKVQPRNNPGFDILVREPQAEAPLWVKVEGTLRQTPQFFVTEGELRFSRRHASQCRLIVVYAIDLTRGAYELFWHEGALSAGRFTLRPTQWACEARAPL